ncbi:MAG: STAS domain-containing protein, partial [bacterium]
PENRLVLRLPVELTAANLGLYRIAVDDEWKTIEGRGHPGGVIVDAYAVEFIDSAALGFLVAVKKKAEQAGITFRCFGFCGGALRTLKLARLEHLVTDAGV